MHQRPSSPPSGRERDRLPPWHALAFLIVFSVVYGVEVSYKFATRQVIFLLNCCHVLTVTNILVLAAFGFRPDPCKHQLHLLLSIIYLIEL